MQKQRPTTDSQPYNIWFDWLRFLAALAVVLAHARNVLFVEYSQLEASSRTPLVAAFCALTRQGNEAVLVFFVLSGFLVGGPAIGRALNGSFRLADYALDRCVRILIPLFPAVLLTAAVASFHGVTMGASDLVGTLASLQGVLVPIPDFNRALWSLSYEVWFYVLAAGIAYLIAKGLARAPLAIAIIVLAALILMQLKIVYTLIWFGGAAAFLLRSSRPRVWLLFSGAMLALAGSATYQLMKPNTIWEGAAGGDSSGILIGQVLLGVGGAIFLSQLSSMRTRFDDLRAIRFGHSLAAFSYSLYLVHLPILLLQPMKDAREVTLLTMTVYFAVVVLCLIAAFFFSTLFEKVGPALKDRLRGTRTAKGEAISEA